MKSLLVAAFLLVPPAPPTVDGAAFDDTWYDGRAEVSGYRWSGTRYGELRHGEAVAIFVTEPYSEPLRVKVDRPDPEAEPVVTALKLNLVRDFQTGIYDYNTMVSAFVRASDLAPLELSFTSAEWCGHVYEELQVRDQVEVDVRSYFQGESGRSELPVRRDGHVGEELFVWIRGLRGAVLDPGESTTVPLVASAFERRLRHVEPRWLDAEVSRSDAPLAVEVPAGSFEVDRYSVAVSDGRRATIDVRTEYPHQLVRWEWTRDGTVLDAGELTGTSRLPYWQLHGEGDESVRADLGLDPR